MRRFAFVVILALLMLINTGCWDYREPGEIVHAIALGFDIDDDGQYIVHLLFPNPVSPATGGGAETGGSTENQPPTVTITSVGQTPMLAITNAALFIPRNISLAHVRLILFSTRLAREGLAPVIDLLKREPEIRLSINSVIVEGDIKTLLTSTTPMESSPAMGLNRLLNLGADVSGALFAGPILDEFVKLPRPGHEMTITRVTVLSGAKGDGGGEASQLQPTAMLNGGGAFLGTKLMGWLSPREAAGYHLIQGDLRVYFKNLIVPGTEDFFTVEIRQMAGSFKPEIKDGELQIRISVKARAAIHDIVGRSMEQVPVLLTDPDVTTSMRERVAEAIKEDLVLAVERAQELGTDIFGFGFAFYRKFPKVWAELENDWPEIFKKLKVEYEVEVHAIRPGLMFTPIP